MNTNISINQSVATDTPASVRTKKKSNWSSILFKILVCLLPWIFTPFSSEYFETTKNIVIIIFTIVFFLVWGIRSVRENSFALVKTPLDKVILIFWIGSVILTALSVHYQSSIWGYMGRMTGGIVSCTALVLLYYYLVNNVNSKEEIRSLVNTWSISISVYAVMTIILASGIFGSLLSSIPSDNAYLLIFKSKAFTPMGDINSVPLLLAATVPLSLYSVVDSVSPAKNKTVSALCTGLILIALAIISVSLPIFKAFTIWALVLIAVVAIIYLNRSKKQVNVTSFVLIVATLLAMLVSLVPGIRDAVAKKVNVVTYTDIPFNTSWSVTMGVFREFKVRGFLFGTGPETYSLDFPRFRPIEQNEETNWNESYTRASSAVFEFLTTGGIFAIILFGLVAFYSLRFIKKLAINNGGYSGNAFVLSLGAALAIIILGALTSSYSVSIWFLLWVLLALIVVEYFSSNSMNRESINLSLNMSKNKFAAEEIKDVLPYIFVVFIAVVSIATLVIVGKNYVSDMYYRKTLVIMSKEKYNVDDASTSLNKAIKLAPKRDQYARLNAQLLFIAINSTTSKDSTIDKDKLPEIQNTLLNSLDSEISRMINLNPLYAVNWETAGYIYRQIYDMSEKKLYYDQVLYTLQQAVTLDPNNPDNYILLGYMYSNSSDEATKNRTEQALSQGYNLRKDYISGILELGAYYENHDQVDKALSLYKYSIEQYYNSESEINKYLQDKVNKLSSETSSDSTTPTPTPTATPTPTPTTTPTTTSTPKPTTTTPTSTATATPTPTPS